MKTIEILRGTFEGKYHKGDRVAVQDALADVMVLDNFAKVVTEQDENADVDGSVEYKTSDEILAMKTKKELESYAASIGMLELDGKLTVKDMQKEVLNYQEELLSHEDEGESASTESDPEE